MADNALFTDFTFHDITVLDQNYLTREDIINGHFPMLNTITRNIRIFHDTLVVLLDILDLKTKTNKIVRSRLKKFTESSYVLGSYEFCMDDDYLWVIEKNGSSITRYERKCKTVEPESSDS